MSESQFARFGLPPGPSTGNRERVRHLEYLQKMRAGNVPGPRPLDIGYVSLSIPELDYRILMAGIPELASPDKDIARRAWAKFARSPASEPYRVR